MAVKKIVALPNGPVVLELERRLRLKRGDQEQVIDQERIALCRCGASRNKPFCDGSHGQVGFQDPGAELDPIS